MICQELGQPYEEYNAKFLRLKRIQEAEEGGFNFQGGEQGGDEASPSPQQAYQPQGGFYQQSRQDPPAYAAASNRAGQTAPGRPQQPPQDEEGWGNGEDLLPD
jgi:hypothetical protein